MCELHSQLTVFATIYIYILYSNLSGNLREQNFEEFIAASLELLQPTNIALKPALSQKLNFGKAM